VPEHDNDESAPGMRRWLIAAATLALLGGAILALLWPWGTSGPTKAVPYQLHPGGETASGPLTERGTLQLPRRFFTGIRMCCLSALHWDENRGLLLAVSDRGRLYHLRPTIEDGRLADVDLLGAYELQASSGSPLRGNDADAEGVARLDDGTLAVSFERRPRIVRYGRRGEHRGTIVLPSDYGDPGRYRTPNKALEALAHTNALGVVSAVEMPIDGDDYTVFNTAGHEWRLAQSEPGCGLVGLEPRDGGLLALERCYNPDTGRMRIVLRELNLARRGGLAVARPLASWDTHDGWRLDNFEGITRFRDGFLMVSDDNDSGDQRTLLTYWADTG